MFRVPFPCRPVAAGTGRPPSADPARVKDAVLPALLTAVTATATTRTAASIIFLSSFVQFCPDSRRVGPFYTSPAWHGGGTQLYANAPTDDVLSTWTTAQVRLGSDCADTELRQPSCSAGSANTARNSCQTAEPARSSAEQAEGITDSRNLFPAEHVSAETVSLAQQRSETRGTSPMARGRGRTLFVQDDVRGPTSWPPGVSGSSYSSVAVTCQGADTDKRRLIRLLTRAS